MATTFVPTGQGYYGGYTSYECDRCHKPIKIEAYTECVYCGVIWHDRCKRPCDRYCPTHPKTLMPLAS